MRVVQIVIALGVTVVLAACASSASSGGTQTSGLTAAQLCALVTPAEVSAALGVSVGAGVPSGVNAPSCTWTAANGAAAGIARVDPSSVGQLPFGLQGLSNAAVTPITGVGDAAVFAASDDLPNAEVDLKKGTKGLNITVGARGITQAQQEAAEKAIAIAAVGRL
jgi:hypothetical protein